LDGRRDVGLGTHTHVQTADERILPTVRTDDRCGDDGPFDSISNQKDAILDRFLLQTPNKFEVAKRDVRLQGAIVTCDPTTGRATAIQRLNLPLAGAEGDLAS
jgi:calcineurin-like phosphoesterase